VLARGLLPAAPGEKVKRPPIGMHTLGSLMEVVDSDPSGAQADVTTSD